MFNSTPQFRAKMKIRSFYFILIIIATHLTEYPAHAVNRIALIFGGNCEGDHRQNQFFNGMSRASRQLQNRNWQTHVLYGDSRSRCVSCSPGSSRSNCCPTDMDQSQWRLDLFAEAAGIATRDIPPATRTELFATLDRIIADPSVEANVQVLMIINTHGARTADGHQELCLSDGTSLRTDDPELIRRLRQLRDQRHVRLGFINDSCFSGASVADFSPFGCVLTSGSAHEAVWGGESTPIAHLNMIFQSSSIQSPFDLNQDHRLSMEELFLENLLNRTVYNQPQISSFPEGAERAFQNLVHLPIDGDSLANGCGANFMQNSFETLRQFIDSHDLSSIWIDQTIAATTLQSFLNSDSMGVNFVNEMASIHRDLSANLSRIQSLNQRANEIRNELHSLRIPLRIRGGCPSSPWRNEINRTLSNPIMVRLVDINQTGGNPLQTALAGEVWIHAVTNLQREGQNQTAGELLRSRDEVISCLERNISLPSNYQRQFPPALRRQESALQSQLRRTYRELQPLSSTYSTALLHLGRLFTTARALRFLETRRNRASMDPASSRACSDFILN